MTTLIFLGTLLALVIILVRIVLKLVRYRSIASSIKAFVTIFFVYILFWFIFYFFSENKDVPLGTDICFDDWCATVTGIERVEILGNDRNVVIPRGQFVILHIKVSNHARRIAQKPSEPRIHIIDEAGNVWSFSPEGQTALEKVIGKQNPIDEKLELHQSVETQLVFDIPKDAKQPKVLIEEGPFITRLLFETDREVFAIE